MCGCSDTPHSFRHHFSHTWPDRTSAEGDLTEPAACIVAGDIGTDVREQVRAVLPDRETTPQRVFSNLEEHQAEAFAGLLLNRFGYDKSTPVLACIG